MTPRVRTLVVHPMLAPYRVDLFNALSERLELEVVFQRGEVSYHRALDQEALRRALRCRFSYLQGNVVLWKRDFPAGIPALLREKRPEVVVTSEFSLPSLLAARCKKRSRSFGHVIWSDESPQMLRGHNALRVLLRRWCVRNVDAMLMCSDEVADGFSRRFGVERERIRRVSVHQSPAVIRARAEAATSAAEGLLEEHGLARSKVLLFVGRLAAVKNLATALSAFADAARKAPDAVFVLVGNGPESEALLAQAQASRVRERVVFAGHCEGERLSGWYRAAGCLLLPSTYEPYGAVVNEALVCGVPVLCSNAAGAAHLVRPGVNGARLDPRDRVGMSRLIVEWLERAPTAGTATASLRADLMPVPFEQDVENFVEAVLAAANSGARGAA
ncbi:glycosyltransferase [Opitutales bacterium ASA1]|uniref:glycosyltransferase n=1 Tax=Congregicoccus parvus TaxID=3081749 RepID=UPI002B32518B|nr:glycosyltransferase [Opitutales bacterium ASA1]